MLIDNDSEEKYKYDFIERNKVLSNSKFNVFFDHLKTNDGYDIKDFMVVKPKVSNDDNVVGICVMPIYNDKFYLMKGWRHQFNDFVFQAPSGFVEKDESASQTALRELFEEVSFHCDSHDLISLGTYLPDAGLIEGKVALFLAMNCIKKDEFYVNEIGTGDMVPFTQEEIMNLINSESNIGGSTIVTALRGISYLQKL